MRHTRKDLGFLIANINSALNLGENEKLTLDYANGGVRLSKYTNLNGGLSDLSDRVSVSEMYDILMTLENTVYKFELIKS